MQTFWEMAFGPFAELIIVFVLTAYVYRVFAGRFLVPKRETVLPYHRGVLIEKNGTARAVESGRQWVWPGQKLLVCDGRPRTLQLEGYRVLSAEAIVLRLSFSGEFKVDDPVLFLASSANATDKFSFQVRETLAAITRKWTATDASAAGATELISASVLQAMQKLSSTTGIELLSFRIWELHVQGNDFGTQHAEDDVIE